jgi:hypothetical protein
MTSLLEFNARAALCRRLAKLEPDCRNIWLAEAERWSRLTQKPDAAVVAVMVNQSRHGARKSYRSAGASTSK